MTIIVGLIIVAGLLAAYFVGAAHERAQLQKEAHQHALVASEAIRQSKREADQRIAELRAETASQITRLRRYDTIIASDEDIQKLLEEIEIAWQNTQKH